MKNDTTVYNIPLKEHQVDSKRILYTPSSFAKDYLLHLQEAGELQAIQPHTNVRDGLASYLVFLVLSGEGELEYDSFLYSLTPGDCVFIDCRKAYAHSTSENLWKLRWVHFDGPGMKGIYQKYCDRGGKPCFKSTNVEQYDSLLSSLYQTAISTDYVRDMRINEGLAELLTILMEESWSPVKSKTATVAPEGHSVYRVKEYLDRNYTKKVVLDDLAEQFYINKFYLARLFKEQFGSSVLTYVLYLRISQAKRLLRFTDQSIDAIGKECGMPDGNYFARSFRKVEGMTPSEYRKKW